MPRNKKRSKAKKHVYPAIVCPDCGRKSSHDYIADFKHAERCPVWITTIGAVHDDAKFFAENPATVRRRRAMAYGERVLLAMGGHELPDDALMEVGQIPLLNGRARFPMIPADPITGEPERFDNAVFFDPAAES